MRALEGIRVIKLAAYAAVPSGGRVLADWDAEVIELESPKMDIWRSYGKTFAGPANDEENPVFDVSNANKKNLCMDLKNPEAMEAFHKLLATADVFIINNRPKPLKRMGLDYESLKAKYPRLVCDYVTGCGGEGPDAALFAREKTGRGGKVSVSLFGLAAWVMSLMNTTVQPPFSYKYPNPRQRHSAASYAACISWPAAVRLARAKLAFRVGHTFLTIWPPTEPA